MTPATAVTGSSPGKPSRADAAGTFPASRRRRRSPATAFRRTARSWLSPAAPSTTFFPASTAEGLTNASVVAAVVVCATVAAVAVVAAAAAEAA